MRSDILTQEGEVSPREKPDTARERNIDTSTFDFERLDRVPKSQLRALHLVHENFVRSVASSLSAYLRSNFVLNLVSLEQISYSEFVDKLESPTCLAYIGMQPHEGIALLELNMGLMFALIELLLGSKGQAAVAPQRKITDIEKSLVQTLLKLVLRDLSEAWKSVADLSFSLQGLESEPQLLHVLAPTEAVIEIDIEVKVEGTSGLMHLAIPSIFIKRLRTKFDLMRQVRRKSREADQLHIAHLLQPAELLFEAWIDGGRISTQDLINLKIDDVLVLDNPDSDAIRGSLNGRCVWSGSMTTTESRLGFQIFDTQRDASGV